MENFKALYVKNEELTAQLFQANEMIKEKNKSIQILEDNLQTLRSTIQMMEEHFGINKPFRTRRTLNQSFSNPHMKLVKTLAV
jgi:hypothetical protein